MCPTTDGNAATVVQTVYVQQWSEWENAREQVIAALDFLDGILSRRREKGAAPLSDQYAADWLRDRLLGTGVCTIAPLDDRLPDFDQRTEAGR
jgi:hypothetical protein